MNPRRHTFAILATATVLLGGVAVPASSARSGHHVATRTFSFLAKVVKSGPSGLLVSAASGKRLWFPARQIHRGSTATPKHHKGSTHARRPRKTALAASSTPPATPSVTISIVGLQPGVTVQITETVAPNGDITVTITLPPPSTIGSQSASGVVTQVDDSDFILDPGNGNELELNMQPDSLLNLGLDTCELVSVSYHQDAGLLIADSVQVTGSSSTGDCAPTSDAIGTITRVSGSAVTIKSDSGPMSFVVDSSDITDGYQVGDLVDVTYTQNTDGSLDASDVEYFEGDDTGVVTAVTATSLTITDDQTGQPDRFIADPSNGVQISGDTFTGVSIGDHVDVTFYTAAAGLVADTVTDPVGSGA